MLSSSSSRSQFQGYGAMGSPAEENEKSQASHEKKKNKKKSLWLLLLTSLSLLSMVGAFAYHEAKATNGEAGKVETRGSQAVNRAVIKSYASNDPSYVRHETPTTIAKNQLIGSLPFAKYMRLSFALKLAALPSDETCFFANVIQVGGKTNMDEQWPGIFIGSGYPSLFLEVSFGMQSSTVGKIVIQEGATYEVRVEIEDGKSASIYLDHELKANIEDLSSLLPLLGVGVEDLPVYASSPWFEALSGESIEYLEVLSSESPLPPPPTQSPTSAPTPAPTTSPSPSPSASPTQSPLRRECQVFDQSYTITAGKKLTTMTCSEDYDLTFTLNIEETTSSGYVFHVGTNVYYAAPRVRYWVSGEYALQLRFGNGGYTNINVPGPVLPRGEDVLIVIQVRDHSVSVLINGQERLPHTVFDAAKKMSGDNIPVYIPAPGYKIPTGVIKNIEICNLS